MQLERELSPETIKILWRFMKYEWLETKAYNCWKSLIQDVEHILRYLAGMSVIRHFGYRYVINFV